MRQLSDILEIYWMIICGFPKGSISAVTKHMRLSVLFRKVGLSRLDLLLSPALRLVFPGTVLPGLGRPR